MHRLRNNPSTISLSHCDHNTNNKEASVTAIIIQPFTSVLCTPLELDPFEGFLKRHVSNQKALRSPSIVHVHTHEELCNRNAAEPILSSTKPDDDTALPLENMDIAPLPSTLTSPQFTDWET